MCPSGVTCLPWGGGGGGFHGASTIKKNPTQRVDLELSGPHHQL